MTARKPISWKTRCAAALLDSMLVHERGSPIAPRWYDDAKKMTEDQFLSLFEFDHNILHETGHPNRDAYWNLTPMLIRAHRDKTKLDAKLIAHSKRVRAAWKQVEKHQRIETEKIIAKVFDEHFDPPLGAGNQALVSMADAMSTGLRKGVGEALDRLGRDEAYKDGWNRIWGKRKIRSRGFDRTKRRKMSGQVVDR